MKAVLFILWLAVPIICIAQGEKKNGWTEAGLVGKVKILRSNTEVSGTIDELRNKSLDKNYWVDSFNNTGQHLKSYSVEDGKIILKTEYKYDTKGSLIEATTIKDGEITKTTYKIKYDRAGNQIDVQMFENTVLQGWSRYKYESGRLAELEDSMVLLGKSRSVYKHNDKGQVVENHVYSTSGSQPNSIVKFKHDDKGNQTEIAWYNADGMQTERMISKYDEHNNKILDEYYDNTGKMTKSFPSEYTYDGHGNYVRWLQDAGLYKTLVLREIVYY